MSLARHKNIKYSNGLTVVRSQRLAKDRSYEVYCHGIILQHVFFMFVSASPLLYYFLSYTDTHDYCARAA